ncbi:MAG: MFS transporter [Solimonas sp.]
MRVETPVRRDSSPMRIGFSGLTLTLMSKFTIAAMKKALFVLSAAAFVSVSAEMMPAAIIAPLSRSLRISQGTAGLLVTAWAFTVALTGVPLVRVTLRRSRTALVFTALLVLGAANVVTALAPTFAIAMTARVLGAAAHGLFWGVIVVLTARLVPPERAGRALAIVMAGPNLAGLLGLPLGSRVAETMGWRAVFLGLAVLCAVCAALVRLMVPDVVHEPSTPLVAPRRDASVFAVLAIALGGALGLVGHFAAFTFIAPLTAATLPSGALPSVLLAMGVGGLLGALCAGAWADRWPRVALPATLLALAGAIGALALPGRTGYVIVVAIWGMLIGVLPVVLQAAVMRAASAAFMPFAGSALVTVLNSGVGAGAALGSQIVGSGGVACLPIIAALVTAAGCVAVLCARRLRRTSP